MIQSRWRVARSVLAGAVVAVSGFGIASSTAGATAPPGCWDSQVGLYNQPNQSGWCYGFTSNNYSFDSWPGIKDNLRSAQNGSNQGYRSCVFRDKNYAGGRVSSLAAGQKYTWGSIQGAESNNWVLNTSCPL